MGWWGRVKREAKRQQVAQVRVRPRSRDNRWRRSCGAANGNPTRSGKTVWLKTAVEEGAGYSVSRHGTSRRAAHMPPPPPCMHRSGPLPEHQSCWRSMPRRAGRTLTTPTTPEPRANALHASHTRNKIATRESGLFGDAELGLPGAPAHMYTAWCFAS